MPLLGRCAASPGVLRWERVARLLSASLRAFRPDLREPFKNMQAERPEVSRKAKQNGEQGEQMLSRKWPRACGRNCVENLRKMVRKCAPEAPKSLQNRSREPPGGLPRPKIEAATFFDTFLTFLERSWGALGALLAAPGALRGRSWSLRGRSGSPFWPPRGHFLELFEALLAAPWKNTKSY